MKTLKPTFLLIVIFAGAVCFSAQGQVTVGSDIAPLSGVLLDIKSHTADANNATTGGTTGGGLGLPRVILTDVNSLAPFLPSAASGEKTARAGLMVYNVSTTSPFTQGVYVWDGSQWNVAGGGGGEVKYFYMPSLNIPITSLGAYTFNLHDAYKSQFTKAGNTTWASSNAGLTNIPSPGSTLYTANELDYVVTYYDKDVITINSISAAGLMSYTVNSIVTSSKTYFNIIFVVK
jgi:hypothetical protein